jgi:uncharacterized protein (TIRG00374 family)
LNTRKILYWTLAVLISAGCLYAALRGLDWRSFLAVIRSARAWPLAAAAAISLVSYAVRALRWRHLARLGSPCPLSFGLAFWSLSAGTLLNNVVPARFGDIFRVVVVSRRSRIGKAGLLVCVVAERFFDVVTLQALFFVSLLVGRMAPAWSARIVAVFVAATGLAIAAAVVVPRLGGLAQAAAAKIGALARYRQRIDRALKSIEKAMRLLRAPRDVAMLAVLSLAAWLCEGWSAVAIWGSLGRSAHLTDVYVFLTALAFAAAIPSTPGSVGVFQLVGTLVLVPMGLSREVSLGFVILWQGVAYVLSLVLGAAGLLLLNTRLSTKGVRAVIGEAARPGQP